MFDRTWLDLVRGFSRGGCICGWRGEFTTEATAALLEALLHECGQDGPAK